MRASEYYETFPAKEHKPGDIWTHMPTYGTMRTSALPGLIITPACDLANRKVETVTYLPVLPIVDYFQSRAALRMIANEIDQRMVKLECGLNLLVPDVQMRAEDLSSAEALLLEMQSDGRRPVQQKESIARCVTGIQLAQSILAGKAHGDPVGAFRHLLGEKGFKVIAEKIVRNAQSADLHFLPADGQRREYSALPAMSVALFRYPLTIPIDILDSAAAVSAENWANEVAVLAQAYPCVGTLSSDRPVKSLTVRPRFISDLLTRFIGLYGRLGSPDFTDVTVRRYVDELRGES